MQNFRGQKRCTKGDVQVAYRVSHDVTAAIFVSQKNETAAMLVSQTNPLGVELFLMQTLSFFL